MITKPSFLNGDAEFIVFRDPSGEVDGKGNQKTVRLRRDVVEMIAAMTLREQRGIVPTMIRRDI